MLWKADCGDVMGSFFCCCFPFGKNWLGGHVANSGEYIEEEERWGHTERNVKRWKHEYEGEHGGDVRRYEKVWSITEVPSPPVTGGEKPVKADDIFTHLLAAFEATIIILISSPQRFFF